MSTDPSTPLGNGEIIAIVEPDPAALELYEDRIAALGFEPVGFKTFESLCDWILRGKIADLIVADRSSFLLHQCVGAVQAALKTVPVILVGGANLNMPLTGGDQACALALHKPVSSRTLAYAIRTRIRTCCG
ncbi:hypothetical protein LCM4579_23380 [Ensifer sp. LCM 4579]|nr:hypothetical protein LCM4579_23380 [Ensifer sp. LCM 4579]